MIKQVLARLVAISLASGLIAACTSLRVTSDVNRPLASTIKCQSYDWAGSFKGNSDLRSTIANPVNEARLREAIEASLNSLGIRHVSESPDCLVGYGIGAHNVVEGWSYPGWGWGGGWGLGWGWGPGYGFGGWADWDYPYVYQEGVIGVDLYDGRSKQAIWHASANQNLVGATGEKAEKKIQEAVTAIFAKYPHTGA